MHLAQTPDQRRLGRRSSANRSPPRPRTGSPRAPCERTALQHRPAPRADVHLRRAPPGAALRERRSSVRGPLTRRGRRGRGRRRGTRPGALTAAPRDALRQGQGRGDRRGGEADRGRRHRRRQRSDAGPGSQPREGLGDARDRSLRADPRHLLLPGTDAAGAAPGGARPEHLPDAAAAPHVDAPRADGGGHRDPRSGRDAARDRPSPPEQAHHGPQARLDVIEAQAARGSSADREFVVGLVGYTNAGKSTLLNWPTAWTSSRTCPSRRSTPGRVAGPAGSPHGPAL